MHETLPATPTDRSVPGDGVILHARDWGGGRGVGRPFVLLHGLSSNARIWDGVAPRLAAGGGDAAAKRAAVEWASRLLPHARVTWFEDTMHDIPLQRPAELAAELASFAGFASEAGRRG